MVGHPHDKLEWEVPPQDGSGQDNRLRDYRQFKKRSTVSTLKKELYISVMRWGYRAYECIK